MTQTAAVPARKTAFRFALTTALVSGLVAPALAARPVSEVALRGNEFISEEMIRAACDLAPETAWGEGEITAAKDCLENTGAFAEVKASREGRVVTFEVQELNNRPGRLQFGIGYDTRDGVYGNMLMERYNLLPGVFGGMELRLAKDARSLETYLYKKGALGAWDLGLDNNLREQSGEDYGYTHRSFRFEPYVARQLDAQTRVEAGLGWRSDSVFDVEPGTPAVLAADRGVRKAPYLRLKIEHKQAAKADSAFSYRSYAQYQLQGLGRDARTSEVLVGADARYSLNETWSLGMRISGGAVKAHGEGRTRAVDRFAPGGADFRGFAHRGTGPTAGDWHVGGTHYAVASLEIDRSIGDVLGAPARLGAFVDVGNAWGFDAPGTAIRDSRKARSAVGMSMTVDLGGVPVSAYIAKPVSRQSGDKGQSFGLSVSFLR